MIISDLRRIIHRTMVKLWEGLNNSYLICVNSYKMHHIEFPLPGYIQVTTSDIYVTSVNKFPVL